MQATQRSSTRMFQAPWLAALVVCGAIVAPKFSAAQEAAVVKSSTSHVDVAKNDVMDQHLAAGRTIALATDCEKRLQLALERPFTHDFDGVSLAAAIKLIEATVKCNVIVDRPALERAGIEPGAMLRGQARGRAMRRELHEVLATERLDFIVRNDCILITTEEQAENHLPLRLYQVHDLVMDPSDGQQRRSKFTALLEMIPMVVASASWRENGGTWGEIRPVEAPGVMALAISQNAKNHDAIEELLAQLRAGRLKEVERIQEHPERAKEQSKSERVPVGAAPSRLPRGKVIYSRAAGDAEVRKALERPATFDWVDAQLADVAAEIRKKFGIGVELDEPALTADGKGPDTKITFRWREGSLGNALRMLLDEHGLRFRPSDGVLLITTASNAPTHEPTYVYQVHDLLSSNMATPLGPTDFASLIEIVQGVVGPEQWREGGAYVGIHPFEAPGLQVLNITTADLTHDQVERFFEMIRDAYDPKVHELQLRRPKFVAPSHPATRGMGGGF